MKPLVLALFAVASVAASLPLAAAEPLPVCLPHALYGMCPASVRDGPIACSHIWGQNCVGLVEEGADSCEELRWKRATMIVLGATYVGFRHRCNGEASYDEVYADTGLVEPRLEEDGPAFDTWLIHLELREEERDGTRGLALARSPYDDGVFVPIDADIPDPGWGSVLP